MMTKTYAIAAIASLLFLVSLIGVPFSQNFGQSVGGLVFNVSLGGTQTKNYTIFDAGSAPITFTVSPPQYNQIANETTPTVTVYPTSGTLQPQQSLSINVTVHMPSSNKPGIKWDGIMQAIATTSTTNPGGAVIQGGLGKEVVIYSSAPKGFSLSSIDYIIIGVVVAVVAVGAGVGYVLKGRKGKGSKKSQPKYKYVTVKKRVRVKA